jgi:3-phenylpropionate/trans-cinnamate dioxygenase ferredoxin reductase subunit
MLKQACIIAGASHAGVQLALSLRQGGWEGRILMLGEEAAIPYQRPPLSKDLLAGTKSLEQILIRPAAVLEKAGIELQLGCRVEAINRVDKKLHLDDGSSVVYDKLALTLGSRARTIPLPGSDKTGVFYLRAIHDVQRIRPFIAEGKKAVIVGGGYIGLETAAVMRKLGMNVTILEALPRILQRVTTPAVSSFYERIHIEEGVKIITNAAVESIEGKSQVESVHLSNGTSLEADLVIIAVGILPNTELAGDAGLEIENGISVDEFARTSDHDIVAAGDCTYHFNPIYQRKVRLESVQNATDQAKVAAATLCGKPESYRALPWFWSDQYNVKLQIAGLSEGHNQVIVRGNPDEGRSFAAFYFAKDRLLAVDAINRPAEFMLAKKLLLLGTTVDKQKLSDDSVTVRGLLCSS